MGQILATHIPHLPTGSIIYQSGEYHNVGPETFDEDPSQKIVDPTLYLRADGTYEVILPKATAAIVPNPSARL
jgi:hypothetical protein